MKLTTLFFIIALVQVSAKGYSQKINLDVKNKSLEKVLKDIERQTAYVFFYDRNDIKSANVQAIVKNGSIEETLKECFKDLPLSYKIIEKNIVILRKDIEHNEPVIAAVNIDIKGKIIDEKGDPLPGASVKVKGTNLGSVTDTRGEFTLKNIPDNATLVISFVGYVSKEISAKQDLGNIQLSPLLSTLNDIVVVGYGTQKKVNLTGAVSAVKMDDVLGDRPVSSASEALQGALAGLNIAITSGQPGTGASFDVRGFTSINGGGPLILVDNIPATSIDGLNPQDIDNVSVLKDASASAIYGARAAFGVILITTKKGKKNQPVKMQYSTNLATTQAAQLPTKSSPSEFINALLQTGTVNYWTGQNLATWQSQLQQYQQNPSQFPDGYSTVGGLRYSLAQVQQYHDFFPGGFEQEHNLSVTGGSDKTYFRASVGYANQNGPIISSNDTYKKYNLNATLTTEVTKKLTFNITALYNNTNKATPYSYNSLFYNLLTFPSFTPKGMGTLPTGVPTLYGTSENLAEYEPPTKDFNNDLRLSTKIDFTPIKNLTFTGEYSFDQNSVNTVNVINADTYVNPNTFAPLATSTTSSYSKSSGLTNDQNLNVYGKYTLNIPSGHNINVLIGANAEVYSQQSFTASRLNLLSQSVPSLGTSTGTSTTSDSFNQFSTESLFGRLNYDYKGKYLLEASARYDGTSRFPDGHRFGFFPSGSLGWNVTDEAFAKPLTKIFSVLKPRVSYGSIGNQVVLLSDGVTQNYYPAIPGLKAVNANWQNPGNSTPYLTLSTPPLVSANFTWETIQTTNFGIDLGFFNNKLSGSFDYFIKNILGMLQPSMPLPALLGATPPTQNSANAQTKGIEVTINWADHVGDFKYSIGANLSNSNARITKYNNPNGLLSTYYTGQQIGEIWGYVTQGYFSTADFVPGSLSSSLQGGKLLPGIAPYKGEAVNPGDVRFVDLNNDGVIYSGNGTLADHGDQKIIGNNKPRYQYGMHGTASYKNFDFAFDLNGVGKQDMYMSNLGILGFPFTSQFYDIFKNQINNFWTPTNTNAYFPRLYSNASGNSNISEITQTKYLLSAAYLRIRNLGLGYTFPQKLVKKLSVDRVRIFFSGENLFTFDHLPNGVNPELSNLGNGGQYPLIKKYSFGLNITL